MYRRILIGQLGQDPVITFAVDELARYLKQMDHSLVIDRMLFDEVQPEMGHVLWVGFGKGLDVPFHQWDDEIALTLDQGKGCITGSNARSVLIGVYRFLKELGCSFLHPGKAGERVPEKKLDFLSDPSLTIHLREKASYRHRGVCIEGADSYENIEEMIDFLPKVGLNEYYVQFMVPTEFFDRWYNHRNNPLLEPEGIDRETVIGFTASLEAEIKKRGLVYHKVGHGWTCEPFGIDGSGWFQQKEPLTEEQTSILAEVGGKRELWGGVPLNTNLCYSNDSVRGRITDAITRYAKENPQVDILHFWLADGSNNHCECENCRKKRPADWYVKMLNELDEKMSAEGLSTRVVFLIYVDLLWEPVEYTIQNPDRFILMFAPITRNYGSNYSDYLTFEGELPAYERNHLEMPKSLAQNLEHLRRWQKQFQGDSFDYDYHLMWAHVSDFGYERVSRNLFQDMKDLRKIGLNGMVSCQVQRCFFPTALPLLAMAAALWDENADFDQVADAYYQDAFGPDGARVRQILTSISNLFHLYEGPARAISEGHPALCENGDEVLKLATELRNLAASHLGRQEQSSLDWSALLVFVPYLQQLTHILYAAGEKDIPKAKETAAQLVAYLWEKEPEIQPLLDTHNTVNILSLFSKYMFKE